MFDFCASNRNRCLGSLKTPKRRVPHWRKPVQRPTLEILEDRTVLSTWYVNSLATGLNNGQSWANAYTDLQSALTSTQLHSGDQVWVAQGTYKPTSGSDRTATFALKVDGVQVYGGFAGNETLLAQRDWVHHVTILSGDIGKSGDNSDNSYHVVTTTNLTSAAVLDGFTITAGNGNGSSVDQQRGAGMCNTSSSPTLTNLIFYSNSTNNTSGGLFNSSSSPTLTNVIFSSNSTIYAGGGMYNYASSSPTLTNVTFSNNSANFGGGMENYASSSPTLTNCILWGDKALGPAVAEIDNESAGSVTVSYSDVQGGWAGTGNINADPRFVDPAHGDLHLQAGSPAIDAGTNTFSLPGTTNNLVPSFDLDNNPRPVDGGTGRGAITDMGAYEFQVRVPTATTTTLTSGVNPSLLGQAVTFTAIVAPASGITTPTGTVKFFVDGSSIPSDTETVNGSGQALFTSSSLSVGIHSITAQYVSDTSNFIGSNSNTVHQTVNNHTPPVVTPPSGQTASEGASQSFNLGSFSDPAGGPWTAIVDWGDKTFNTITTSTAGPLGPLNHIYGAEGNYTATVTVRDSTGLSDSKSFTAAVTDPAVVALGGFNFTATEGAASAVQAVATFTDPGGPEPNPDDPSTAGDPYTTTIAWGDGTSSPGVIALDPATGVFAVSGGHTYGEEGSYTVATTIGHNGVVTKVASTATVSDPAVVATGGFSFAAAEGAASAVQAVATFTDPGGPEPNASDPSTTGDPYVATVAWGDGSTSTATLANGGIVLGGDGKTFTVNLAHTYGEEGSYTIITTIAHEDAMPQMVASTAIVSDPAVVGRGLAVNASSGKPFTNMAVATFTDPGVPDPAPFWGHYSATINWGDGTSSPGAIALDPGTGVFTISGDHTYSKQGSYPITTSINHEGIVTTVTGSSSTATITGSSSTATIKESLGLLLLDPSGKDALSVTGNGSVVVNGYGAIIVDSSNSEAAIVAGNGVVSASDIDVTGSGRTTGHGSFSIPVDHEAATPDPLGLPLPTAPSPNFTAVNYSGSTPLTLSPGTYVGGIKITGNGSVTLLSGIYYMKGGGFSVTGQGSITGSGVMIVNAPATPSDTISFTGKGNVTLTPSTTLSSPYEAYNGITIFQDPTSSAPINITGQGSVAVTGAIYAPQALLNITGQGGMEIDSGPAQGIDAQCIVFDLTVTGQGRSHYQ